MLAAMQNANKDRWILLDIQPATDPKHGRIVLEIQNGDLPNWNASLFVLCRAFRALSLMAFTCAAAEIGCVFQSVSNLKKMQHFVCIVYNQAATNRISSDIYEVFWHVWAS